MKHLTKKQLVETHMMVSQMHKQGFSKHSDDGVCTALAYAQTMLKELKNFVDSARHELGERGFKGEFLVADIDRKVTTEIYSRREFDVRRYAKACKKANRMGDFWKTVEVSCGAMDEAFPDGDKDRAKVLACSKRKSKDVYAVRVMSNADRRKVDFATR